MFALSKLNLNPKKNSKILLSDFRKGASFSMLCLYESSASSDTGHFLFIQQNSSDGIIAIKKLIWISECVVYAFAINPLCDWLAVSLRNGSTCIMPLGALMGRVQKRCEHWKTNDLTYLPHKLKHDSPTTCMKWWISSKNKNTCLIGKANGDLLIIDLANGSLLYSEEFSLNIKSIDLLFSSDGSFSYAIITNNEKVQWKLLLEEIHNKEQFIDKESGFEGFDLSWMQSSNILESKSTKKHKGDHAAHPTYVPTKLYQFSESTFLKSQSYNDKYFVGAYDCLTGKYKLYDCANLDSSLYDYQLPLDVVDICVTDELLFIIVQCSNDSQKNNAEIPSVFQEKRALQLSVMCRQYAQNHLFEKYGAGRKNDSGFFKPRISNMVSNMPRSCVLFEVELRGLFCADDILEIIHFPYFFNFDDYDKSSSTDNLTFSPKNQNLVSFINQIRGKSTVPNSPSEHSHSKWSLDEIKQFTPIFIVERDGVSICHLKQCFEDKFIDLLLDNDTKGAEWLGAGLRLDMNFLYQYTAKLLVSGNAQLGPLVTKSTRTAILEFFDLGYTSVSDKLACLTQFWTTEDCLQYALTLLSQVSNMSPIDRAILSNGLIPMFGFVMSEPSDDADGTPNKKNKYYEKFKRFVIGNCFFNDFLASKTMIGFGQVDEAFFIAKEKGCVVDLFKFLMENGYVTNWSTAIADFKLQTMYARLDRDFVLCSIGQMDWEIVARSDPKLLKSFGEFVCQCFMNCIGSVGSFFSFQTTTHLCTVLNPYGVIIDTLFHIYSCTTTSRSSGARKERDLTAIFDRNVSSSTESLTSTQDFSMAMKIRREIGPELLAFCLLVISRDNQINGIRDYIYFIQLYYVITSTTDADAHNDNISGGVTSTDPTRNELFESRLMNKNFKLLKPTLSSYWTGRIRSQYLAIRHDLCISISIFDLDLFEDDLPTFSKPRPSSFSQRCDMTLKKSPNYVAGSPRQQHCQINMLGFQKEKMSRVLLLPKSIEGGKEIVRQIALGKQHVLILTDCGSVYGAGSNVFGQLGIDKSLINETSINRKTYRLSVINPQPINMGLERYEIVVSIAAGDFHSGAIAVNTEHSEQHSCVLTWGWGVHGQLGHNDIEDQRFPKRLVWDWDKEAKSGGVASNWFPTQLSMGCYHSVLLTNTGHVYSFGNNSYGQLGTPGIQKSTRPLLIQNLTDVTHIDTKYCHTVCSTMTNEIFVWGLDPNLWQNQFHREKSHAQVSTPVAVSTHDLLQNEKIVQISCGINHTTILSENKLVYSFGSNIIGQLGMGNRKDYNHLVEVKVPKPIDFISSDNGVTVGMNVGEQSSKIMVWGRCGHPLVQDNIKGLSADTVIPQLLKEYQHSLTSNFIDQNCFGVESLGNFGTTILNKHQLMIFFLNCSEYIERNKLIRMLTSLKEYDVIADYCLVNDMIIESLFWRIRSLSERIKKDFSEEEYECIKEDVEIIFQFYIRVAERPKISVSIRAILTMITGSIQKNRLPWNIFEKICRPLLHKYSSVLSKLLIRYSLESELTSGFIRDLLLSITDENTQESVIRPALGNIVLSTSDMQRFNELLRSANSETIYDAADDHKVVFFAGCNHAAVLGRYREQQVKVFVDKLRKRQLNFSTQMIQRLYNDSSILPDCLECLSQRL